MSGFASASSLATIDAAPPAISVFHGTFRPYLAASVIRPSAMPPITKPSSVFLARCTIDASFSYLVTTENTLRAMPGRSFGSISPSASARLPNPVCSSLPPWIKSVSPPHAMPRRIALLLANKRAACTGPMTAPVPKRVSSCTISCTVSFSGFSSV